MKKVFKTAIALGVVLFACLFNQAFSQFSVIYTLKNAPSKTKSQVAVKSVVKNMKALSKGIRIVEVSNNPNMNPVVQSKKDSVFSYGPQTFYDTLPVSVSSPNYYYIRVRIITHDNSGKNDTAKSMNQSPVFLTPPFTCPSGTLNPLQVSMTTATISGTFESGYDSAEIVIWISYGDTILENVTPYPIRDTIGPKIGSNQKQNRSYTLDMGAPGYYFSYEMWITNIGCDYNLEYHWGKTLDQPAVAIVSTPYNQQGYGSDSVTFKTKTTATGLATKHWSYIATSQTSNPFDSVITMIPAGSPDDIVIHTIFKNQIAANSDYWVWSCVKNSMNVTPFCSNRVLVQTGATQITTFKIRIDSVRAFDANTEAIYWTAEVPESSGGGKLVTLGRAYPSGQVLPPLTDQTLGWGTTRMVSYYPNCSPGTKYQVTIYGYDDAFTKLYDAWNVWDTFTFQPKPQTFVKKIVQVEKLSMRPNPATDLIHTNSSGPYSIHTVTGQIVQSGSGSDIDVSNLNTGIYIIKTKTGFARFQKQ